MTTEEKLKEYILLRYKSVREFATESGIAHSTINSVFIRGIGGTTINTIIKICKALNISVDALADGEIVPKTNVKPETKEVKNIVADIKFSLTHTQQLTIDGRVIEVETVEPLLESLEIGYEMSKRKSIKTITE